MTRKNIDLPELKARFDTLYFQLQILEKAIEIKQNEISGLFGKETKEYLKEISSEIDYIKYFCNVTFPERINSMKLVINKIKRLAK